MTIFLDTSVFISAFWQGHQEHKYSLALIKTASPEFAFCAAHTIAEVYSCITRLPVSPKVTPQEARLLIQTIRERFSVIGLTTDEYFDTVERLAAQSIARKQTYDGLIMAAAAKCRPDAIYTFNLNDFLLVSPPELRDRVRTPPAI